MPAMVWTTPTIPLCYVRLPMRRRATIIITFKMTGAAAAIAKRPVVFKIPENKAAKRLTVYRET